MIRAALALATTLAALSACSRAPRTDEELTARAQQTVDHRLGAQALFSLMESIAAKGIACGHATVPGPGGQAKAERDFVYRDGTLVMDDDPAFDGAARDCDAAATGAR